MNVPLAWLSDYIKLPKSEQELTDRLTLVGHMLDKRKEAEGDVIIDLELRGNRADMFGMIGVARDLSAIFDTPMKLPSVAILPKTDPKSPLLSADAAVATLVKRYIAVKLEVTVKPSPEWMATRLRAYGIEPINNVVDVTNYVMVETSHPMHAFDFDKVAGGKLHLRMAKTGERFDTIQQGTTLTLTKEDIAIADSKGVQCLTCIGGTHTKVTDTTTTILLETAVYHAASCRRTARRHKVMTESGNRHEKHQDPEGLPFALARAIKLLEEAADAKVVGNVSDYYPQPTKPVTIPFNPHTITRLVGVTLPTIEITRILTSLGCSVKPAGKHLSVTVPSFRTDIEQEADIVEEVIRVWGYDKIPVVTLSGELPTATTPAHVRFAETLRTTLQTLQMNEVITSTLIPQKIVDLFQKHGTFAPVITLVNAPDPDCATLRPSLLSNLVQYAKRSLGFRQKRIAFFEIGNTYFQPKKKTYTEELFVGLIMGGSTTASWETSSRTLTLFDLKGVVEALGQELGFVIIAAPDTTHPSLGSIQAHLKVGDTTIGTIGMVDPAITKEQGVKEPLYYAELSCALLMGSTASDPQPYQIAPQYPPILEDVSLVLPKEAMVGPMLSALKTLDPLIAQITLADVYEDTRTLHIVYQDPTRNLTTNDVTPVREKILACAKNQFGASVKSA
jgi:phenylalanyl-tRNA synthetase beta chain